MEEKINYTKALKIIVGLLICLLSISLSLNIGYIGRTFSFPFLYLFGTGSLLIYIFAFIKGLSLVLNFKIKLKINIILGLALFIIGILFLLTYIILKDKNITLDVFSQYNAIMNHGETNYYKINIINPFIDYGGGIIGYFVINYLLYYTSHGFVISLIVIFVMIGIILIFIKQIISVIKHNAKKIRKQQQQRKVIEQENLNYQASDIFVNARNNEEQNKSDALKDITDQIDIDLEEEEINNDISRMIRATGTITKPTLDFSELDFEVENKIENKTTTSIPSLDEEETKPEIDEMVNNDSSLDENTNNKNIHDDQLENAAKVEEIALDFNAPAYDKDIVSEKPEIIQPVEIDKNIKNEYQENKPNKIKDNVSSEPKIKKPIKWVPPSSELLIDYETPGASERNIQVAEERMKLINQIFDDFRISAKCVGYIIGPSITRFEVDYAAGTSTNSIARIVTDISRRLKGLNIRFEPTVYNSEYSGIEVPNAKVTTVGFKDLFLSLPDAETHPFEIAFGKSVTGEVISANFTKFPHMLVAGATRSGKSVFVKSIITTLIMRASPEKMRLVLIDPKRVEMSTFQKIPHLLCPIITAPDEALEMLKALVDEMEARYEAFNKLIGVVELKDYNEAAIEKGLEPFPYIFVFIDEYQNLTNECKDIENPLANLTAKARAVGIHILVATQRPTVDVITGKIKANLDTRVSLKVASAVDSSVILDEPGAETLLGYGDLLAKCGEFVSSGLTRLQGCYIDSKEMNRITNYLRDHYEENYDERFLNLKERAEANNSNNNSMSSYAQNNLELKGDPMYETVKEWVMSQANISMSRIQNNFPIGTSRAGRLLTMLQKEGIVDKEMINNHTGYRVLVTDKFNDGN